MSALGNAEQYNKFETTITHSAESIWHDGIAFEEVWCIYLIAVTSKIAGKELNGDY